MFHDLQLPLLRQGTEHTPGAPGEKLVQHSSDSTALPVCPQRPGLQGLILPGTQLTGDNLFSAGTGSVPWGRPMCLGGFQAKATTPKSFVIGSLALGWL